jgi:hypothetical protein
MRCDGWSSRPDPLGINVFVTQGHAELREFVDRFISQFRADQLIST